MKASSISHKTLIATVVVYVTFPKLKGVFFPPFKEVVFGLTLCVKGVVHLLFHICQNNTV